MPLRIAASLLVLFLALSPRARDAAAQVARDTARLEELSVSATRVPVSANAVTASVAVISGAELRERGIVFVADALRELSSAAVVQGGGIGGVGALFLRGGESDYVKVLVDGVPLNDAGGAFNFANLTTANIDRIEVVRGPVSVLYGSDAVSGLVQIFTRRGAGPVRVAAAVEGGTDATTLLDLSASGGRTGLEWSAGAARVGTEGMYDFNSDYRNVDLSGRLAVRPDLFTSISGTLRYSDARSAFPTDFMGVPSDSNQFGTTRQLAAAVEAARFLTSTIEARASVSVAHTETGFDDQPDHPGDDTGFGFRSERATDGDRVVLDARAHLRPAAAVVITAGVQHERETEDVQSETESDFGTGPFVETSVFDAARSTTAVYAQALADLASGLALTLNGRADHNSAFGTLGTLRAGAAYRFAAGTRIRGSIGTAYKAPTFCELFCSQPFIVGNPTLEPEHVTTWELGAEQPIAGGLVMLGATWFNQSFDDRIEYVAAEPEEPNYFNLTAARARGLELAASASPAPGLGLTAAYTWLDTETTDDGGDPAFAEGSRLLRRPEHTVSASARYAAGRAALSAGVVHVGERDDIGFDGAGRVKLPGYTTVNAALVIDLLRTGADRSLAATFRAENLFDEQYEQTTGFPGRGRMIYAGVRAGL